MKSEWKTYTVQELIDLGMLEAPMDGNHGNLHPKVSDYVLEGIPFIMANDLVNGKIDYKKCAHITEAQARQLKKGFAHPGDVLLTHKATIGRTALVGNEYDTIVLTPQITYYRVKKGISNRYLKAYFDSKEFQELLSNWAGSGSTRAYLGITAQRKLPILLPSIDIQNKIASYCESIDGKITVNSMINDNLEQQASAIYQAWFEEFLLSGGSCPSTWKHGILADIANITSGKRPSVKFFEMTENAVIPIVGAASIMGYTSESNHTDKILVTGRVGTHGVIQRFSSPCWTSDNTLVITSDLYEYTYQLLKRIDYHSMNRGSTQPLITQSDMNKVPILIPDSETLNNFELLAGKLMEQYQSNLLESRKLAELRDTLLPKLISGEIDVSNLQL